MQEVRHRAGRRSESRPSYQGGTVTLCYLFKRSPGRFDEPKAKGNSITMVNGTIQKATRVPLRVDIDIRLDSIASIRRVRRTQCEDKDSTVAASHSVRRPPSAVHTTSAAMRNRLPGGGSRSRCRFCRSQMSRLSCPHQCAGSPFTGEARLGGVQRDLA